MNEKIIIIIDDNKVITSTLHGYFEYLEQFSSNNFKIYVANDGIEGLGLAYVLDAHAIIIDSTLPRYSGRELTEMLTSNQRFEDKLILAINQTTEQRIKNLPALSKTDPDFLSLLVKKIALSNFLDKPKTKTFKCRLVESLVGKLIFVANKGDRLIYDTAGRRMLLNLVYYLIWIGLQVWQSLLFVLFKLLVPPLSQEVIIPKDSKFLKYRVFVYPTLVTLATALIFLMLQFSIFMLGGITIFSTLRLESIFALNENQAEYIFNVTEANNYESYQLQFTATGVELKKDPVEETPEELLPTIITVSPTNEPTEMPAMEVPTELPELLEPSNTPEPTATAEVLGISSTQNYTTTGEAYLITKDATNYSKIINIFEYSSENDAKSSIAQETSNNSEQTITYQLSPDGNNWYYLENDTTWVRTQQGVTSSNLIQVVNANIADYQTLFNTGTVYFKIFLRSSTPEKTPILNRLVIEKENALLTTIDENLPSGEQNEEQMISTLDFNILEVEIFNASYVGGQKVVLGKVLNIDKSVKTKYEVTDEELALHTVKVYYANGNSKGSEIGETTLYKNSRGEIEFLLRTPSNSGGYVTAEVTLNDESISLLARPVENSTLTVDSTGDEADASAGDGLCATAGGTCTLRAAIQEANALSGADNIYFNIPTSDTGYRDYDLPDTVSSGDSTGGDDYWTIRLTSVLPIISETIVLDGATQKTSQFDSNTFGPDVEIKGIPNNQLLNLQADSANSVINHLVLNGVTGSTSYAAVNSIVSNVVITGNYIGSEIKGLTSANADSTAVGVLIRANVGNYVGTGVEDGNVIVGFREGVRITCTSSESDKNYVRGNYIGLGSDGTTLIGNSSNGIFAGPDCKTEIGGDSILHRNYISGSGANGISFSIGTNTTAEIHIFNNYFGTDVTGTLNKGNVNTDVRIQGGGTATSNIQRVGGAGKGNLMRFTTRSIWLNAATPMNVVIEYNTISDQINGNRGILLDRADNNTIIQNNAIGAFESDPYFGKETGPITGEGIQMRDGGSPIIRGNIIQSASTHGIGIYVGNITNRSTSSANRFSNPIIGGQNPLAGSLCNGLEQNCIRNNAYSGIYSIDTVPANEATLWADNDFSGGNGDDTSGDGEGDKNIVQSWNGLWEIHSSSARRTDLSGVEITFPDNTFVTTAANLPIPVTNGTAINVTCLGTSGVSCPATGHTSGTLDNTYMLVPSGQSATVLNDADFWFRVTEYIYDSAGNKTDYSTFKFDQPHFASGTFTFDGDSTDNVLNTGSARTIDSQNYTDRGEPWTDKPAATRNVATNDLGRFQIMEVEYVDANPVEQEDGNYVITVDSTSDEDNVSSAYFNDGTGTASGGGTSGVGGIADGKTSLREAIAVSNNRSGFDNIHFLIPETDSGFINPDGSRTSTLEGAGTYPTTPLGYFTITHTGVATITDSVHINGQSMPGTELNSAGIGETLNANLRIQIVFPTTNLGPQFYSSNNIISGLNLRGISSINGSTFIRFITSDNNWIYGNYLGADIDGTINSGYRWGRMSFESGSANNIVGTDGDGVNDLQEKNLLTGYATHAMVWIGTVGPGGKENSNNVIAGNYLRTDKTGRYCNPAMFTGNDRSAIALFSSANATRIGTNSDGISDSEEANIAACVYSDQSYTQNGTLRLDSLNNIVVGNYINTNPQGDNLNPNPITQGNSGIKAQGYGNIIKNNVIRYSSSHGIYGRLSNFYNNVIEGNVIEENQEYGIYLDNTNISQPSNIIRENIIRNNVLDGIRVTTSNNNHLSRNLIYDNNDKLDLNLISVGDTGLGITANDAGDTDNGANDLMNYPEIGSIEYIGAGQYEISGTLDNTVDGEGPFEIEICLSSSHTSGHGGCSQSLGILENVVQNMNGPTNWSTIVTVTGDDGSQERSFTTLATNTLGSTSEFSANVEEYEIRSYPISLDYPVGEVKIDNPTPTFVWTASLDPDLKEYQVYLDNVLLATVNAGTSQYLLTTPITGVHSWQVKAMRINDTLSGVSSVEAFSIELNTDLELVYPANGAQINSRKPLLDWNATDIEQSTHYEIYLDGKLLTTLPATDLTQYQINDNQKLALGNHKWSVISFYRADEFEQQTGETAEAEFNVALSYLVQMQILESTIKDGKYIKFILAWQITGSDVAEAEQLLLQVITEDGSVVINKILSADVRRYELLPEELSLIIPGARYTIILTVLGENGAHFIQQSATLEDLLTLPNTGTDVDNGEEKIGEPTITVTPTVKIESTRASLVCVCLISSLSLLFTAIAVFFNYKKRRHKKEHP